MVAETYSSASLNVELANGRAVVHGVERGDLVHTHGGHLEQTGHLVHDADAAKAVLTLTEIEQGHDGRLLVLRRVALDDLLDDLFVVGRELEGEVGVVVGGVTMLYVIVECQQAQKDSESLKELTTYHHEGVARPPRRDGEACALRNRGRRGLGRDPGRRPDGRPHEEGSQLGRHGCLDTADGWR